jgi:hypothetical protein
MNGRYGAFSSNIIEPNRSAHVFSYTVFVGPIPPGMELDHKCFVHHCVNPEHLRPATKLMNQLYRKGANRNSKSGYLNVHPTRSGKWDVAVTVGGKTHYGPVFETPEDANEFAITFRQKLLAEYLAKN